jgi:serine/threonine protein kinase
MASLSANSGAARVRSSASDCPTDADLLAFIPGLLADEDAAAVLNHLQSCAACQSRVTTLTKKLSTEGHKPRAASPANEDRSTQAMPTEAEEPRVASEEPPAVTLAFSPKRQRIPSELGNYQLLRPIGRGGMGVVYKAYNPRLQRYYAIKLLPALHLGDDTAIVRLGREMAAAGRVEHENIVYSSDAGTQDGIDYLVMEFVEGVDLSRLVAACDPLPVTEACEIMRQAALGLAHIEACGLVHRDIKPSNLMLSAQGTVKILDLGLARLRESPIDEADATHTGFLLGTADYISPEQIDRPRSADVRSDLYSLGCAMYKLLAGRAPFSDQQHSSVTSKIDAHRQEPAPPIRTLRPDVPAELEALLNRLLAKDPDQRPAHPAEVAEELSALAAGADLLPLVQRAMQKSELDLSPPQAAGHTPSPLTGSTRPLASGPTPRAAAVAPAGRRQWLGIALGGLVAIAAIGAAVAGNSWRGDGNRPTLPTIDRGGLAKRGQQIAGSGRTVFDLRRSLDELKWEGHVSSPPPFFNDNQQMLEVRPDSFQFLAIGEYDGQPGAFEVTIRQSPWHGDAGLFFGYRHEPQPGYKQLATFQLVRLWHYPVANARGERLRNELQLVRERGVIRINPQRLGEEDFIRTLVPYPESHQVRLRIEFGGTNIERILLDGAPVPELCASAVAATFTAADHVGVWGLYAAVSDNDMGPTWFGNLAFTPTEKSP